MLQMRYAKYETSTENGKLVILARELYEDGVLIQKEESKNGESLEWWW